MSEEIRQAILRMDVRGMSIAEIARLLRVAQMDVQAVICGLDTEMIKELRGMRRGR